MKFRTVTAMILAYLVPGAGHFFLGRRLRALAFFFIIVSLFLCGIAVDGKVYSFERGQPLNNLATAATLGSGLLYLAGRFLGPFGDIFSATYEHGTAFILTAGLMNLLLVLDSYDIAQERKP